MKLEIVSQLLAEETIDLKDQKQVDRIANGIAGKGFPKEFGVLYKTSQGDLSLDFELSDRKLMEEEDGNVIRFDYRLTKESYGKIIALQKKIKGLPEADDPDGEKYDDIVSETNFDGVYLFGKYTSKPTEAWGKLD